MEFVSRLSRETYKDFAGPYGPSTFGKTELSYFSLSRQYLSHADKCCREKKNPAYYLLTGLVVVTGVTITFISGVDEVEVVIITFISFELSVAATTTGDTGTS